MSERKSARGSALMAGGAAARRLGVGVACCLLSVAPVAGQEMRFDILSRAEGLSQISIQGIYQDDNGYMWFGTQDGLNRFDGYQFTHYKNDAADPHSISGSFVWPVTGDREGHIWAGTDGQGLNQLDPATGRFRHFLNDPEDPRSISHNRLSCLYVDATGRLWIGTIDGGLNRYEPGVGFVHYRHDPNDPHSLANNRVWSIGGDEQGRLWLGTNAGLEMFDPGSGRFTHHGLSREADAFSNVVWTLYTGEPGVVWVGTWSLGLFRYQVATGELQQFRHDPADARSLGPGAVCAVRRDSRGVLWVGLLKGGLCRFNEGEGTFSRITHDSGYRYSLSGNSVLSIYESREGVLWFGTGEGGISKFDPNRSHFHHFRHVPGKPGTLAHPAVSALDSADDGSVWIATGTMLNQLDPATGLIKVVDYQRDDTSPRHINAVLTDAEGMVWTGLQNGGLDRFDPRSGEVTRFRYREDDPSSICADSIFTLFSGRRYLWLGSNGGGLLRYDPREGRFKQFLHAPDDPNSLTFNAVLSVYEDRDGEVWVGPRAGGLDRLDAATGGFIHHRQDPDNPRSLSYATVSCIAEDHAGNLWLGTWGGGLNRLNRARADFDRLSAGLPNLVVNGLLCDRRGDLWVSTNQGISRVALSDPRFEAFLAAPGSFDPADLVTNFDFQDGLQGPEFTMGAYTLDRDGYLYFGGNNGLNRFLPEKISETAPPPPILLTTLRKFGADGEQAISLNGATSLRLDYRDLVFALGFSALDFRNPPGNRYAYRLEGFRDEWIQLGNRNEAVFTGLPPGSYRLHVRGAGYRGPWNDNGPSLRIFIAPPPWLTWWAKSLYAATCLGLLLAGFAAYRLRIKKKAEAKLQRVLANQQRQKMESLGRLAGGIAHDFNNMLASMLGFNSLAMFEVAAESPPYSHLTEVENAGERAKELIRQILTFSRRGKPEFRPVPAYQAIVEALKLVRVSFHPDIELVLDLNPDAGWIMGDATHLHQVVLNLCTNARQAIAPGRGQVRLALDNRWLERPRPEAEPGPFVVISVTDNGSGIRQEHLAHIFEPFFTTKEAQEGSGMGLSVVHGIVAAMGGFIEVHSQPGKGAEFQVWLPQTEQAVALEERTYTEVARGAGERILFLDDEPSLVKLGVAILERLDYRVTGLTDAAEALNLFRRDPAAFDLVITDWRMPGMRGDELARAMLAIAADTRIMLCTSLSCEFTRELALGKGLVGYLFKPFTVRDIAEAVADCLRSGKAVPSPSLT